MAMHMIIQIIVVIVLFNSLEMDKVAHIHILASHQQQRIYKQHLQLMVQMVTCSRHRHGFLQQETRYSDVYIAMNLIIFRGIASNVNEISDDPIKQTIQQTTTTWAEGATLGWRNA